MNEFLRQPEGESRSSARSIEQKSEAVTEKQLEKIEQNLYGIANDYTDQIRKLAGRVIEGSAEKVGAIEAYIIDQAATIHQGIVNKALEKMKATNDVVEKAKILEATIQMLKRRVATFKATFVKGIPDSYEDKARAADHYRASTELARNSELTKIYESVCRGTPLNGAELSYLIERCSADKIKESAQTASGDLPRKYMQVGMGTLLYKMSFDQKAVFAAAYVKAKGAEQFAQLAELMLSYGALKANEYQQILSQIVSSHPTVQAQLAQFDNQEYVQKITALNAEADAAYKKAADDMKKDYDINGFQRSMTGKNLATVIGSIWLGAIALFNGLATYTTTKGKSIGEKLTAVGNNVYLTGSVAGLIALGAGGSAKRAKEKYLPDDEPGKRKELVARSKGNLLEVHQEKPRMANWLAKGGMGLLLAYHQADRSGELKARGADVTTPEGKRQLYLTNPTLLDGAKLLAFLESDAGKNFPNKDFLAAEIKGMAEDANYADQLNPMLNDGLKTALNARIYSQKDYNELLADFSRNRSKYQLG